MREAHQRLDETDRNVAANKNSIEENRQSIADVRRLAEEAIKEVRNQSAAMGGMEVRVENAVADELRERESRKLNLVLHGVPEVDHSVKNPRDRMEKDKDSCSNIIYEMRSRGRSTSASADG